MEINKKIYRIFGRTRGRKNNKSKIDKYFKLVSQYKFNKLDEKEKYILDIGTGYGETTMYFARKYYNYKIIACDKYIDGNLNLLKNIQLQKINNIYIHNGNVHEILDFNIKI